MCCLVHRAKALLSLRAGDKRGCAWQLASGTCLCFPRQTQEVLNQPTDTHKFCLLIRAVDPTEVTRRRVFTQIY